MSYKYVLTSYDHVADWEHKQTFKSKDDLLWFLCFIHEYGLEVVK